MPHVKDLWDTYCEKNPIENFDILGVEPTWASFLKALKEQYYHVGDYDDQYTNWTILRKGRDKTV